MAPGPRDDTLLEARPRGARRRSLFAHLTSPRLATWLIGAVGVMSLLGMIYPQRSVMTDAQLQDWHSSAPGISTAGEWLGLDHLFTTWYFVTLLLLLVLATALCSLKRVRARRDVARVPERVAASLPAFSCAAEADPDAFVSRISGALSPVAGLVTARVAEEHQSGEWRAVLVTGRLGFAGSMVFHLALIVIALGAVYSSQTTFTGRAVLTEGQTFVDEPGSYLSVTDEPRMGQAYSGASLTLDRLQFIYEGDALTRGIAHATVQGAADAAPATVAAEVNYPIEAGGKSLLLGNSGYSVGLRIGAEGAVTESYYTLGKRAPGGYNDTIELPGGVTAAIYALPRPGGEIGSEVPRRYQLEDPVVHAKLMATGRTIWEGDLVPGTPVEAQGYRIELFDVRLWNEFLVRGDDGRMPVYIGLWLVIIGLTVRFADPEKRVFVSCAAGTMTVAAKHRYGIASSRALSERIRRRLSPLEVDADAKEVE